MRREVICTECDGDKFPPGHCADAPISAGHFQPVKWHQDSLPSGGGVNLLKALMTPYEPLFTRVTVDGEDINPDVFEVMAGPNGWVHTGDTGEDCPRCGTQISLCEILYGSVQVIR